MVSIQRQLVLLTAVIITVAFHSTLHADTPDVKTAAPVIYLQDNLDEEDNLGWCIDTVGRGFAETIHAHTCKPQGGDVQFDFNAETGNIASAEFTGKCLTITDKTDIKVPFGLFDCAAGQQNQQFTYNADSLQFHPADDESLCIAVGPSSRKAGPFMSRDLLLSVCKHTDPELMQWIVKKE